MTQEGGTHELSRCYYQRTEKDPAPKYTLGSFQNGRVGQFTLLGADLRSDGSLELTFTGGYRVLVPSNRLASTYRVTV